MIKCQLWLKEVWERLPLADIEMYPGPQEVKWLGFQKNHEEQLKT